MTRKGWNLPFGLYDASRRTWLHSEARVAYQRGFSMSGSALRATREGSESPDAQWEYPISTSERLKDRKSVFMAHASTLPTPAALDDFLSHLVSLPTLKKATHCMYAYRIVPDLAKPSIKIIGQNDGGERGSGERLTRLLEALECENVIVVVSRWYGGVKLGSDRWKLISTVAKEALRHGNFVKQKEDNAAPNPGKVNRKPKKK